MTDKKRNFIFILLDGSRFDFLCEMPAFSGLLSTSTSFTNMIVHSPYTIASMHAIFSGLYGADNGVDNYFGSLKFKKDTCKTLTRYFRDAGYSTTAFIINPLVIPHPGFDNVIINKTTENLLGIHKKLIQEAIQKKPYFLFIQYNYVHGSMVRDVIEKVDDLDVNYFRDRKPIIDRFRGYMKETDSYLKGILDFCRDFDDTVLLFISDHGTSTGERYGEKAYGIYCYDYSIKTYACFVNRELFPPVKVTQLTRTVDLFPTILDLFGFTPDPGFMKPVGESLLPLCRGGSDSRTAYVETGGLYGPHPSPKSPNVKCIRTDEWKIIYNTTTRKKEFYNLKKDPMERNNLAGRGFSEEEHLWRELKKQGNISE